VVSFVGDVVLGVPGLVGPNISITTVPLDDQADSFPSVSAALTLMYQVPSLRLLLWVNELVALVLLPVTLLKSLLSSHCTVYGVPAKPLPPSVLAVHVQDGVRSVVGVVVDGVPGVEGAVASSTKATLPLLATV